MSGYRNDLEARALAAEARAKELEESLGIKEAQLEKLRSDLDVEKTANRFKNGFFSKLSAYQDRRAERKREQARDPFHRSTREFRTRALKIVVGVICAIGAVIFMAVVGPPSCAPEINGGTVTNLYHHHPFITTSTTCTGSGRSRSCHTTVHHHPEKWTVEVCDEGVCVRPSVPEAQWNRLHLGQYYCFSPPCNRHSEHEELYHRD